MYVNKRLIEFFEANKDKPKKLVVELTMKEFGYKESTAKQRYCDYNNSNNLKKTAFEFFMKNPCALEELDNKTYSNKLGMPIATYAAYKSQYKAEQEREKEKKLKIKLKKENQLKQETPKYGEKYYKGRLREFFKFDDSKLFDTGVVKNG